MDIKAKIKKEAKQAVSLAEKFKKFCARQKKNSDQRLLNKYKGVLTEMERAGHDSGSVTDAIGLVTLDREKDRLESKIKKRGLSVPGQ